MFYKGIYSQKLFYNVLMIFIALILLYYVISETSKKDVVTVNVDSVPYQKYYDIPEDFKGFDNVSGTSDGRYIVPNYVHFVRLGQPEFKFSETVCVLAALKNQKPLKIFFHTDTTGFRGKYWEELLATKGFREVLSINKIEVPTEIFGQNISQGWRRYHGGDVARFKMLMKFGGIFLDNDSYIVRSLDPFRKFEMTLGWMKNENLANQVIIAHKNARFLRLWLETYRDYKAECWYCNAGVKPTQEVLVKMPELIHRMPDLLAAHDGVITKVFMQNWDKWRNHYAIHLLINHQYLLKNISEVAVYPVEFNETNILDYPITFKEMVFDVYPGNATPKFY